MAEDDIYGSKKKYEHIKENLSSLSVEPSQRRHGRGGAGKYYCKNPVNLEYFKKLFEHFEAKDISYIRRVRLIQSMRLICHLATKDLADCTRDDVNLIAGAMHTVYKTPKSKETFVRDIKYFWKLLFPETDEQGRPDETRVPYAVRHLSTNIDKSRQKLRKDKLSWEEFERVVDYFSGDPRIQAYLTLALESLARPQELLYVKTGDVELFDNYAKIYISEHGKEGVGLLQCIDSYPYVLKWLNVHPLRKNKEAFLFINVGDTERFQQLKPANINKLIRTACNNLGIDKPVTCYSLKRNGVTIRRLRGETDMEIQHAARWTSAKQLKTYDLTNQDEAFRRELEKRGLVPSSTGEIFKIQKCAYCNQPAGFGEIMCQQCKRPLDRTAILQEAKQKDKSIEQLKEDVAHVTAQLEAVKQQLIPGLMREILEIKKTRRVPKASASASRHEIVLASIPEGSAG